LHGFLQLTLSVYGLAAGVLSAIIADHIHHIADFRDIRAAGNIQTMAIFYAAFPFPNLYLIAVPDKQR
jgi:hypothetical protein